MASSGRRTWLELMAALACGTAGHKAMAGYRSVAMRKGLLKSTRKGELGKSRRLHAGNQAASADATHFQLRDFAPRDARSYRMRGNAFDT